MKKWLILGGIVLIFAVALGLAFTRNGGPKGPPPRIETVRRGDFIIRVNATGNLESLFSVDVKSNVEGEIQKLYVKEGDFVEKGQVLLKIDDEQIREEMRQAEANVAAAQAQYDQALRNLTIRQKQLESELQQQEDSVRQAEINLKVVKANSAQLIAQAETNIQNIRAQLAQDKIALNQAKIAYNQAQLTLAELESAAKAAQIELQNAEAELKRTNELFEKGYVSKKTLENAQAAYANAQSRYESAQKRVQSQQQTVESQKEAIAARERAVQIRETTLQFEERDLELLKQTRKAEEDRAETQLRIAQTRLAEIRESLEDQKEVSRLSIKNAEANLLRAQSSLKNAQERLGWTTIVAPMSGTVINLEIEEGEIITSGRSAFSQSPPLMTIVDLSQMVVKTYINEVDMEKLRLGQKAQIRVSAYPERVFRGEVREISPSGEPRDNIIYFEVMVAVLGSPKELRPGMTADVDIIVVEHKDALMLPIEAVNEERSLLAQLRVPQEVLSALTPGTSVQLGMGPGRTLTGQVVRQLTEDARGNVEVAVPSAGRGFRPGNISLTLTLDGQNYPRVPAQLQFGKRYSVMLLPRGKGAQPKPGGTPKATRQEVQVGLQNETDIEIVSGLNEGDRVLVPNARPTGPGGPGQRRGRP